MILLSWISLVLGCCELFLPEFETKAIAFMSQDSLTRPFRLQRLVRTEDFEQCNSVPRSLETKEWWSLAGRSPSLSKASTVSPLIFVWKHNLNSLCKCFWSEHKARKAVPCFWPLFECACPMMLATQTLNLLAVKCFDSTRAYTGTEPLAPEDLWKAPSWIVLAMYHSTTER